MSATDNEDLNGTEPESALGDGGTGSAETAVAEQGAPFEMSLDVEIQDVGPCKKHISVKIPRDDIDHFYEQAVDELMTSAEVPGFRKGHVPRRLIGKRFRKELSAEVKQKVLVQSLEQLSEENDLDPINEPNLDVENIELPEEGDFEYEFDIEVRPDFELPDYRGLQINRPVRGIADEDVDDYLEQFLMQYGKLVPHDGPAETGDAVTTSIEFVHSGETLRKLPELTVRLKPVLRFHDAELDGFNELMAGVTADETREVDIAISPEAESMEMRGETVKARFTVHDVKRLELPDLNKEFLQRVGVESEEKLREDVRGILERQVTFQQRQSARAQVLEQITESTDWDLPEELVRKQVENAMHREILEMQQAGFTTQEIQARKNELRQRSVSTTRQAMKEHFVLDKIATEEDIEVTPSDIETEIQLMAMQRGESPRRLRARLTKSGVIENLEAQIRERKAVDVILDRAVYEDVVMERPAENRIEAVNHSICGTIDVTEQEQTENDEAEE